MRSNTVKIISPIARGCSYYVAGISLFTIIIGLVSFIYNFASPLLSTQIQEVLSQSLYPLKEDTAFCLTLSGITLWLLRKRTTNRYKHVLASLLALVVFYISIRTVFGVFSLNPNVGVLYSFFPWPDRMPFAAMSMVPILALGFLFISLSLLLLNYDRISGGLFQVPIIFALFITIVSFVGQLYQTKVFYIITEFNTYRTGLIFLLCTAILLSRPYDGMADIFTRYSIGGRVFRYGLVFTLLLPIAFGYLAIFGPKTLFLDPAFYIMLITVEFILILVSFLWGIGVYLDKNINHVAKSTQQLRIALESAEAGIWNWSLTDDRIIMDTQMRNLFGLEPGAFVNTYNDFLSLMHVRDRKKVKKQLEFSKNKVQEFDINFRVLYPDTSIHHLVTKGRPYQNPNGEVVLMAGVCWDMTARMRMETRIKQAKKEAERFAKNAVEASRAKTVFLANMSHDLRTPLNGIYGFTEFILSEKAGMITDEQKEYLNDIVSCTRQLLAMIDELLDIAKIEAGKMQFHPKYVDVTRTLKEAIDIFSTLMVNKNIALEMEVDPSVKHITIDPTKFKQVIYNYVSNAFKFTYPGGRIVIRVLPDRDNFFRLEVEDTGIGIRQEDIPKLFLPFQQVDKNSIRLEGFTSTGLGLALTRQIVEAQGGQVGVVSEWEKGSIFYAILPCIPI